MTLPADHLRRSPLYRKLAARDVRWTAIGDAAVVGTTGARRGRLMIADLSPLPRLGFKGRGTIPAMQARGLRLEAVPNRAFRQEDGSLCLVLGAGEVLLLSNLTGDGRRIGELQAGWSLDATERTYPLLRRDSHAWFAVAGPAAPEMLAKLCAVDFSPAGFPPLVIAQTTVAKISAIVTSADCVNTPLFHVLADSAAANYFFECLVDAALEFGGTLAGLREIEELEIKHDEAVRP